MEMFKWQDDDNGNSDNNNVRQMSKVDKSGRERGGVGIGYIWDAAHTAHFYIKHDAESAVL